MNGLIRICLGRFVVERMGASRAPAARGPASAAILRPALAAALLGLVLAVAGGRCWAQGEETQGGGPAESMLGQKSKPEEKKSEVLPPPPGMSFVTRLDRTAVWVVDQFHYLIIVDYTPEYEFVLDNLTKETLNMDPLQVMDVGEKTVNLLNHNKRLYVDLALADYGTGQNTLQVPQFTLYYFRKDRRAAGPEQAIAESLTVPGPILGLRSTLPPQPADVRDAISISAWDRSRWILPAAAMLCALTLAFGIAWELVLWVKRRKARKGPDRRKAMEAVRARWAASVPSEFSDRNTVLDFLGHSDQNVKEFVSYYLEIPTLGLTSDELQQEMQRLGANPEFLRKVVSVLGTCEALRYAPDGADQHADAARSMAQDVREILSARG